MPYFLHVRGTRKGPLEIDEVQRMIEQGTLTLLDQVWDAAGNEWTIIRDFPDIAKYFGEPGPGDEFIINVDGKTGGPFPYNMILREIEKGRFRSNHFVWDEVKSRWIEARLHPVFESHFIGHATPTATYHVAKGGVRIGPIPFTEVIRLINVGELTPEDHLWNPDAKQWVTLNESTDFSGFFKGAAVTESVEPEPALEPGIFAPKTATPVSAPGGPPLTEPPPDTVVTTASEGAPPFPEPAIRTEEPPLITVTQAPVEPPPPAAGPPIVPETPVSPVSAGTQIIPTEPGDIIEIPPERTAAPEPVPVETPPAAPTAEVIPERKERPAVKREPVKEKPVVIEREEVKTFEPTRPSPIKRLVAQVIDIGFISVAFLAVLIVMTVSGMNPLAPGPEQETYRAAAYIAFGAVALLYFFFRDGFGGASIGKRVMGLKVVHGYDARPANPIQSFVRNLFLLIPILNIAELFMVFTEVEGRRLGDKTIGCALMYGTEAEYIRDYGLETSHQSR
ncbi:MAG: DUF4339 domain-containing protein [Candidatus Coatesbacteria bacterium]|nr:MAG: DUF4339 domain-containing protein [Candidatus Coatesbacteria bacterium]